MIYESVYSIDSVCVWQNLGSGERVLYSLYGIVEHSGSMRGGHYAAYVKVRTPQRKPEQRRNQSGTKPPRQLIVSMCSSVHSFAAGSERPENPVRKHNLEDAACLVKAKWDLFVVDNL